MSEIGIFSPASFEKPDTSKPVRLIKEKSGWLVDAGIWFYGGMAVAAVHLGWQIATLDTDDPQNCLERFRSNNGFGFIVFAALTLDVLSVAIS